jgi:hypothetical protein
MVYTLVVFDEVHHAVLLLVTTEVPDIAGNEDVRGKT